MRYPSLYSFKCATADEQDILGIHVDEFLLRMLASALWRDIDNTSLEEFQQCLLHTLPGNVTCNGRVVTFAGDFVDFVDEDDTALRLGKVIVSFLKKPRKKALHILAHITCLSQHCRVNDGERNLEKFRNTLGQQCLAGTCRSYKEDIRFLEIHPVISLVGEIMIYSLVMIIYCDRQEFLGPVLTDYILVKEVLDFLRLLKFLDTGRRLCTFSHIGNLLQIAGSHLYAIAAYICIIKS